MGRGRAEFPRNKEAVAGFTGEFFNGPCVPEAAIRAKSSEGSPRGIIENGRTYYCIATRLFVTRSTDMPGQTRYPVLLGRTKESIVREEAAIAEDNVPSAEGKGKGAR